MYKYFIFIAFQIINFQLFSQAKESINKLVSVSYKNTKIETALADIEAKSDIRFSYNPEVLKNISTINYATNNQPIKEILLEILDGGVSFKTRGNYIILQKKKEEEKDFLVMGYISNEITNERIYNASIYEPKTLTSTLSNKFGYYQIRLRRDLNAIDLKVQKQEYVSETVKVPFRKDGKLNIGIAQKAINKPIIINSIENISLKPDTLKPIKTFNTVQIKPIENVPDTVYNKVSKATVFEKISPTIKLKSEQFMDWLMSSAQKIHFKNIDDSLNRPFQMSLLPYFGTNGRISSTVSNDVSINIISGVSKSINKFEAGGFLNLVRNNMTGVQMAGFGNIVGKRQTGLQLAGFSNINFGPSDGVLASGFTNILYDESSGLQMAGFSNISLKSMNGFQMAGFSNISLESMKGFQMAGFLNTSLKSMKGLQMAGFANVVKDTLIGSQIGTFNISNKMKNGVQIGFFNYVKEAENVLPIGFFSYVGKGGYRRAEIGINEIGLAEISFKTGVRAFYNIFSTQYNIRNNSLANFSFGYGLGTSAKITNKLAVDLNVIISQFISKEWNEESWSNQLANANLNLEFKLGKRFALFGGPSLNWYNTNDSLFDISTLNIRKITTSNNNWWGTNQDQYSWLGFKAGIRLCNI